MARYIFVTGGVVSSLGKGLSTASLANLLKSQGENKPDSGMGESVAHLCSLAFDIAGCSDEQEISKIALEGIFNSTQAHAAAVLLAPYDIEG